MSEEDLNTRISKEINSASAKIEDLVKRRDECARNGNHLQPVDNCIECTPRKIIHMYCNHCQTYYERQPTPEELEKINLFIKDV